MWEIKDLLYKGSLPCVCVGGVKDLPLFGSPSILGGCSEESPRLPLWPPVLLPPLCQVLLIYMLQERGDPPRVSFAPSHVGSAHHGGGESGRLHPEVGAVQGSEAEAIAGLLAVPQPGHPRGAPPAAPAQRCHFS